MYSKNITNVKKSIKATKVCISLITIEYFIENKFIKLNVHHNILLRENYVSNFPET